MRAKDLAIPDEAEMPEFNHRNKMKMTKIMISLHPDVFAWLQGKANDRAITFHEYIRTHFGELFLADNRIKRLSEVDLEPL